jgi:hypothetical protein
MIINHYAVPYLNEKMAVFVADLVNSFSFWVMITVLSSQFLVL